MFHLLLLFSKLIFIVCNHTLTDSHGHTTTTTSSFTNTPSIAVSSTKDCFDVILICCNVSLKLLLFSKLIYIARRLNHTLTDSHTTSTTLTNTPSTILTNTVLRWFSCWLLWKECDEYMWWKLMSRWVQQSQWHGQS